MTPRHLRGPAQRLRGMHERLAKAYGPQHWWPANIPFEVVLGAYLTQNTAWTAVERSAANLRRAGAITVDGLRNIALDDLQELIRPSGFYTRKARALKAFVAMLDAEFNGSLDTMAGTRRSTFANACWLCPALGLRPPMPSCSTRWATRFPWPMSICAASWSGISRWRHRRRAARRVMNPLFGSHSTLSQRNQPKSKRRFLTSSMR